MSITHATYDYLGATLAHFDSAKITRLGNSISVYTNSVAATIALTASDILSGIIKGAHTDIALRFNVPPFSRFIPPATATGTNSIPIIPAIQNGDLLRFKVWNITNSTAIVSAAATNASVGWAHIGASNAAASSAITEFGLLFLGDETTGEITTGKIIAL